MKWAWILKPNSRHKANASSMRSTSMRRSFMSRTCWSMLCTPIWTFVQPSRRIVRRERAVTASGLVSMTSPTTRCRARSFTRCWRSSSSQEPLCHDIARPQALSAP